MSDFYILKDKDSVKVSQMEWAQWLEKNRDKKRVAATEIGSAQISTVFLGLDHSWNGPPPLLFETMVFGGPLDGEQERCSTYSQAEQMHQDMVNRVMEAQKK